MRDNTSKQVMVGWPAVPEDEVDPCLSGAARLSPRAGEQSAVLVRNALDELTKVQQDVVSHLYFRGSSVAVTAAALGMSVQQVTTAAYEGLWRLRAAIDGYAIRQ